MSYSAISEIRKIAEAYEADLKVDEHESGDYKDCILTRDGVDLYIVVTRFRDDYLAYGLESSHLPRELYADSIQGVNFTELDRNKEILENVKLILSKRLLFYPKTSLLNKNRGYIVLEIDGVKTKLSQKRNSLGLEVKLQN